MSSREAKAVGGELWSEGYFASTVGKQGNEGMIAKYVKEQGKAYLKITGILNYTEMNN